MLLCKNINFDTAAPKPHIGIITAGGQLPIGTGNTSPTPEILAGSITSPDGSIVVGYSSPNITIETAAPSSAGAWEFISSATASTSASIDFTDLDNTYFMYMVVIESAQPATDATALYLRTSSNNGVSFDSAVNDYFSGVATQEIRSGAGGGTSANENLSGFYFFYNPSNTQWTRVTFTIDFNNSSGAHLVVSDGGVRRSTTPVNAIRFFMSSGNIASGTFKLYGLSAS